MYWWEDRVLVESRELDFCVYSDHHETPVWVKGYAIFPTTAPKSLPRVLFGVANWKDVEQRWIEECKRTFSKLPKIEGPYKLKKDIQLEVYDDIVPVGKRLYVKVVDDRGKRFLERVLPVFERTMERFNRRAAYKTLVDAINMLRGFNKVPTKKALVQVLDRFRFDILVSIGVLKALKLFSSKRRVYFVPSYLLD